MGNWWLNTLEINLFWECHLNTSEWQQWHLWFVPEFPFLAAPALVILLKEKSTLPSQLLALETCRIWIYRAPSNCGLGECDVSSLSPAVLRRQKCPTKTSGSVCTSPLPQPGSSRLQLSKTTPVTHQLPRPGSQQWASQSSGGILNILKKSERSSCHSTAFQHRRRKSHSLRAGKPPELTPVSKTITIPKCLHLCRGQEHPEEKYTTETWASVSLAELDGHRGFFPNLNNSCLKVRNSYESWAHAVQAKCSGKLLQIINKYFWEDFSRKR